MPYPRSPLFAASLASASVSRPQTGFVYWIVNAIVNTVCTSTDHDDRMTAQTIGDRPPVVPVKLLTVNEVASILGCGRTMVYELIDKGQLTRIKIGRLTRIPPSEVERFVRRGMGMVPPERPGPAPKGRGPDSAALLLPFSDGLAR
jgi:excisionase family DNA binding protein